MKLLCRCFQRQSLYGCISYQAVIGLIYIYQTRMEKIGKQELIQFMMFNVILFLAKQAIFQLWSWHLSSLSELCLSLLLAVTVLLGATPAATRDFRFMVISERPVILTSKCRPLASNHYQF
jgi:hypothetical protein